MREVGSDWMVMRRLGIGDREHVRTTMLSIGCFDQRHLLTQLEAAFRAGTDLGMMARVHINAERAAPLMEGVVDLCHRNLNHQLIDHPHLSESEFSRVFETCDLLITCRGTGSSQDELVELLKRAWSSAGGRFLGGNFEKRGAAELRERYPDLHPDPAPFYQLFTESSTT